MAAAPHAHLGIIDSKRPAAGHAHVGGGLHLSHVCCARPGDVEVEAPITCVETCLGGGAEREAGLLIVTESSLRMAKSGMVERWPCKQMTLQRLGSADFSSPAVKCGTGHPP